MGLFVWVGQSKMMESPNSSMPPLGTTLKFFRKYLRAVSSCGRGLIA